METDGGLAKKRERETDSETVRKMKIQSKNQTKEGEA